MILQAAGMKVDENSGDYGDNEKTDYPIIGRGMKYALYTYRNSVGDINPPTYPYWIDHLEEKSSLFMISLIWVFWFLNQYFVLIIMLNCLISIIGQSF